MRAVPVHYLRANHAVWTPPAVIFLDTESRTVPNSDPEIMALRLWCGYYIDRRPPKQGKVREQSGHGVTAAELVEWIDAMCKGRSTVWLYAHNLSFDLVTTRLPLALVAAGWTITDAAVGGKAPWLRFAKGTRRLALLDSWSWLPTALETVGAALGINKLVLPSEDDTDAAWLTRCRADVMILAAAVLELMDWWDRHQLGNWTISGAGCGWNAMRHTPTMQKITVDPDPDGIKADRAAIYGGRRGVWRVGRQSLGRFAELDFAAAYPSIVEQCALPMGRKQHFTSMAVDDWRVDHERWGIIAQVRLRTDVPRWPVKVNKATWFPVGEFTTTLAGPEIADARRLGCLLSIGAGYVHQLGYAMSPWASWVLAVQRGEAPDTPPVARIAAKSWGRAVIGKWASHTFDKTELGPAPTDSWSYEEGFDHGTQSRGGMVDLAGRRWWVASAGEGDNSYPAVLAWVESAVRVRLSRVIEAVGVGCIIQADTDGVVVAERSIGTRAARGHLIAPEQLTGSARTQWVLNQLDPVLAPLTIRIKATSEHVHVIGPQHYRLGGQRRFAGIPSTARCTDCEQLAALRPHDAHKIKCAHVHEDGVYIGRTWPKLQWQMQHGSPAGYVRPAITSHVAGPYVTGWVLTNGYVVPPLACTDAAGSTVIAPWSRTPGRRKTDRLADHQHPTLEGLWE